MLVLTRKVDQGIVIAGNIYVRVLGVERDRVKIGIAAPMEISILRQELLDRDGQDTPGKPAGRSKDRTDGDSPAQAVASSEEPVIDES